MPLSRLYVIQSFDLFQDICKHCADPPAYAIPMAEFSFSQQVIITSDTLINVVGDEAVLLNLNNEQYYGLDPMGTQMWQALTTNATIQDAYDKLLAEYDVSAELLRHDLNDLLEKLLAQGLVELRGE